MWTRDHAEREHRLGNNLGGKMNSTEKLKEDARVSETEFHMQSRWVIKP